MAHVGGCSDDGAMTDEPPAAELGSDRSVHARQLRRRTSDRVVGGVAGGLGDYLNVDPVLLRAAFAGLMIFGGAGLVLYVVGWLLVPAQGQADSILEALVRRLARRSGRLGMAALVLVAIVVVSPWITGYGGMFYIQAEVFWALAIVLVGVVLLLGRDGRVSQGLHVAAAAERPATGLPTPTWLATARPRERSPLGWYVVAAVLLVIGALAVADNTAAVEVTFGQYFGAGLVALGVGLVVGAWWGRARLLVLLGLAALPLALTAAFVTVPLEGGTGDHAYRPQGVRELLPEYRLVGGRIWLDLSHLEAGSQPIAIAASVGVGSLVVVIPDNARVEVDARVDGGELLLFDGDQTGTALVDRVERPGIAGGPSLILTLEAGIGSVRVERAQPEGS